ncbi:MAG TPA: hemin uptake protein HemP [Casimicrobiaceae bacterium]|nr:hemin uptake protein HemP [Casimicrobiaceae bacterium]
MAKDERLQPPVGCAAHRDRPPPERESVGAFPRVVRSDALLAGASQLAILHNDTLYFLRETRFGKLILTK